MANRKTIKDLRGQNPSQGTSEQQQNTAQDGEDSKKKPISEHTWEGAFLSEKHEKGCVNRHVSWYAVSNKCSHRGQARIRAENADKEYYAWPDTAPEQPEKKGGWDPDKPGNFKRKSSVPYEHEAHHIVATAELRNAIIEASEGVEPEADVMKMMRNGIMEEGYNLNNEINMMILPMALFAMKALGLPLHRTTLPHHNTYSDFIKSELSKAFSWIKKDADEHKQVPPYKSCKKKIEQLSRDTREQIREAGQKMKSGDLPGTMLDEIPHNMLAKPKKAVRQLMGANAPLV